MSSLEASKVATTVSEGTVSASESGSTITTELQTTQKPKGKKKGKIIGGVAALALLVAVLSAGLLYFRKRSPVGTEAESKPIVTPEERTLDEEIPELYPPISHWLPIDPSLSPPADFPQHISHLGEGHNEFMPVIVCMNRDEQKEYSLLLGTSLLRHIPQDRVAVDFTKRLVSAVQKEDTLDSVVDSCLEALVMLHFKAALDKDVELLKQAPNDPVAKENASLSLENYLFRVEDLLGRMKAKIEDSKAAMEGDKKNKKDLKQAVKLLAFLEKTPELKLRISAPVAQLDPESKAAKDAQGQKMSKKVNLKFLRMDKVDEVHLKALWEMSAPAKKEGGKKKKAEK